MQPIQVSADLSVRRLTTSAKTLNPSHLIGRAAPTPPARKKVTMFYAVFDGNYEYVKGIYSKEQYNETFGRLHPDYHPRRKSFQTKAQAELYMTRQNERARKQYSDD